MRVDAAVRDEPEQVHVHASLPRTRERREECTVRARTSRPRRRDSRARDPGRGSARSRSSDGRPRSCPSALPGGRRLCPTRRGFRAGSWPRGRRTPASRRARPRCPGPGGAIPQPSRMTRTTGVTERRRPRGRSPRTTEGRATRHRRAPRRRRAARGASTRCRASPIRRRGRAPRCSDFTNACASCAISGVAVLPVPIAQTGSYAMTSRSWRRDRADLPREHRLGLARLALGLGLADARDHVEPGLERGLGAKAHRLVRLAEELPPLGVPDDRTGHAELEQHRRRDLARERPLELPVDVLRVDPNAAVRRRGPAASPRARRTAGRRRRRHPARRSGRRRICAANSRAWCAPLNIFQLPATSIGRDLRLGSLAA